MTQPLTVTVWAETVTASTAPSGGFAGKPGTVSVRQPSSGLV